MNVCQECGCAYWLVFRLRMVCADCGQAFTEVVEPKEEEGSAAFLDPTLFVYFQAASNGRKYAFTYRQGGKMARVPVKRAEELLALGEAVQMLEHPTKAA